MLEKSEYCAPPPDEFWKTRPFNVLTKARATLEKPSTLRTYNSLVFVVQGRSPKHEYACEAVSKFP